MCSFCAIHKALPPSILGPSLAPGITRFQKGDKLYLEYVMDSAPNSRVEAWADLLYDNGETGELPFVEEVSAMQTGTRVRRRSREGARLPGYVVGGGVSGPDLRLDRGQVYVQFGIEGSGGRLRVLGQGYIYDGHVLPAGRYIEPGPGHGRGFLDPLDLGDPAAGADYANQTMPALQIRRFIGFAGTLVADANVADRSFRLDFTDATPATFAGAVANRSQGASSNVAYRGAPGYASEIPNVGGIGNVEGSVPLPKFDLHVGYVIDPTTARIQVGDNWGDGEMHFEAWEIVTT